MKKIFLLIVLVGLIFSANAQDTFSRKVLKGTTRVETPALKPVTGDSMSLTNSRLTNAKDPINPQDLVNLRTAEDLVTSSGFAVQTGEESIKYGLLYNWYAGTDSRGLTASGWRIPTKADFDALISYLGGFADAGGKLKETGTTFWNTPNTGATNETGYNGYGSGARLNNGTFTSLKSSGYYLCSSENSYLGNPLLLSYDSDEAGYISDMVPTELYKRIGMAARPVKITTTLTNGQTGTYTGNDGRVYRTIAIGNPAQEWLAENLAETKYRNGDAIPEVTDNTAWQNLTSGALAAYNNNWENVYETTTATAVIANGDTLSVVVDSTMTATIEAKTLHLSANVGIGGVTEESDPLYSAWDKDYDDLTNKPTSLPASDVYSWAKSPAKPTYVASEVGAAPIGHVGSNGVAHGNAGLGVAGFMSGADKTKLDGIASGATANTGTVTTASVVTANGFSGTVATATTTPAITLSTTITGLLKGNGTAVSAATAGTDYLTPNGSAASLTNFPTFNQNTTGYATYLAGGNSTTLLGSIPYQSNTNVTTMLSPNTTVTKAFLSQTGTGTNGAAPAWSAVSKSDVGLGSVENTALSTWTGTSNITTLGTIGTGTWNATAIADGKIASALTGKTYNGITPTANATGFSIAGGTTSKTLTVNNNITLAGTDGTTITLPSTTGTVPLNNQTMYVGTTALAINRASASQALTGITSIDGSAATLTTSRAIYGNNFNGSAALTQIIASTYGGTGNGFTKFTGPTTSEKTYTLPNSNATLLYSGGDLGTPSSGTLTNCTFPTLNQNTTGSAAKWTTARTLAGNSVDGSANVAFSNKFIVQGTTDAGLSGAQFLGSLGTGLLKNTTSTGVLSVAAAGTDYVAPVAGKGLSTEDYTTAEKSKLAGIAAGAEVNVNADWNATSGDAQIMNKPGKTNIGDIIDVTAGGMVKARTDSTLEAALRGVDYISGNKSMLRTVRRLGGSIVTWLFGSDGNWAATSTPTDASLYGYLLEPIERDSTITGVYYTLQTAGVFTGVDTCSIAIYELDNVTLTKVAEGTPGAAMFKVTANTKASKAFASTYTMKANKLYYVCWLYNNSAQTTAPIFYGKSGSGGSINKFLTGGTTKIGFTITSQASLPATITLTDAQTTASSIPAIWVY